MSHIRKPRLVVLVPVTMYVRTYHYIREGGKKERKKKVSQLVSYIVNRSLPMYMMESNLLITLLPDEASCFATCVNCLPS